MDSLLCDELLQEILIRLPQSSSPSISLVSKRWLSLLRSSTSSLSIRIPHPLPPSPSLSLSLILSHFPSLSSLTLLSHPLCDIHLSSHHLLLCISTSPSAPRLSSLRLLSRITISPSSLHLPSLSHLTSLHLPSIHPLSFKWILFFPSLKSLSLIQSTSQSPYASSTDPEDSVSLPLPLESLSLTGIHAADHGLSWLYRRCSNLRKLQLRACDGTGDDLSFPACLPSLHSLDLRTCRTIADRVLLRAAGHCHSLTSLTLYDGASHHALHHFLTRRGSRLQSLDLRLPLDLDDAHLLALPRTLTTLRLQSCCLVTADGLRSLAGAAIETLALVNCDVVERHPGLLSFLGQSLQRLKNIDLSYNDMVTDKEVIAMLASCRGLTAINLRGCRRLTDAVIPAMIRSTGARLEFVDVGRCREMSVDAVEVLVLSARKLKGVYVEQSKVSKVAEKLMWQRGIEFAEVMR